MRAFATTWQDTNDDAKSVGVLTGSATVRPGIYEVVISSRATPADQACGYLLQRVTTAGSGGTAKTPQALGDNAGTAIPSGCTSQSAPTTEPTYTANAIMSDMSVNLRGIGRFAAANERRMIWIPSTANAGIGLLCVTPTSAYIVQATCWHEE